MIQISVRCYYQVMIMMYDFFQLCTAVQPIFTYPNFSSIKIYILIGTFLGIWSVGAEEFFSIICWCGIVFIFYFYLQVTITTKSWSQNLEVNYDSSTNNQGQPHVFFSTFLFNWKSYFCDLDDTSFLNFT